MRIRLPVLVGALVLAACGGDEHDDLKQWMAEASTDNFFRLFTKAKRPAAAKSTGAGPAKGGHAA